MADSTWKRIKSWSGWVLLGLLLVSIVLSIVNAEAIHRVSVQVIDAKTEVRDPAIPGLDKKTRLPDYRIELMRGSDWRVKLATHVDRTAEEPLEWILQEPVPLRQVTSIRLVEDDKLANDVIEEVQIEGESFSSEKYRYTVGIERSFRSGLDYFFETPIGMTILIAIGLAIFVLIVGHAH